MTNPPNYIENSSITENQNIIITPLNPIINTSTHQINEINYNNNGVVRQLFYCEDKDPPENIDKINTFIDLSNLIFDIREKISDKEYKDIMETMSKLKKIN